MSDIEKKIRDILNTNIDLLVDVNEIKENEELIKFGMNSISFIKIVVCIETEFDIEFNDDDLNIEKFKDIKSLVEYVKGKKQ